MLLSKPRVRPKRANVDAVVPRRIEVEFLTDDYMNAYNSFCGELLEEWQPVGSAEKHLVQTLAHCKWKADRANTRKRAVYAKTLTGEPLAMAQVKVLTELQQHGSRFQRDYQNTMKLLQEIQADRKRREQARENL
jgi:hypothetical protein